jgi:Domain of unknown function (DUF4388)
MSIWLVIGGVVVVALVALVVFGSRRPRRAEDELDHAVQPSPPSATPTSLQQPSVTALLGSMHAGRKTGVLQLTAADQHCSLYFLFGHLFHATSGTLTGEPALRQCLTWQDVRYTFDEQAPLPKVETIMRPIEQILAG